MLHLLLIFPQKHRREPMAQIMEADIRYSLEGADQAVKMPGHIIRVHWPSIRPAVDITRKFIGIFHLLSEFVLLGF